MRNQIMKTGIWQEDSMMKMFYTTYIEEGHVPSHEEIATTVRFFSTFSINSLRLGLEMVGQKMGERLDAYVSLLKSIGWRHGRYTAGGKKFGLDTIISGALAVYIDDER